MSAADGINALHFWEQARRWLTRANILVVGCVTVVVAAYCAGASHGAASERAQQFAVQHQAIVDTIKAVETRYVHDTATVRVAKAKADTARQVYDSAEATVEAIAQRSDSVPSALVVPALHACDQAITADTIAYRAQGVALTDMTADRDAWKRRAELDESSAPKPARFGLRTGIVIGVALAAGAVKLASLLR